MSFSEKLWSIRTVQVVSKIGLTVVNEKLLIRPLSFAADGVTFGSGMNFIMFSATVLKGPLILFPAKGLRHCTLPTV